MFEAIWAIFTLAFTFFVLAGLAIYIGLKTRSRRKFEVAEYEKQVEAEIKERDESR